jgi:membrane-associated phospholipid phosphatase
MFNTNFNHFLQQFDYHWLRLFLEFISSLGSVPIILTILLGIAFGLHFKKGIVLINIVAWTAIFTFVVKQQVDFPRPIDVDTTLYSDDYSKINNQAKEKLPNTFFGTFSDEVLDLTRNDLEQNYGFPSGHTAIQIALWMGMFFIFRKRWIAGLGIVIILLTILSRTYLAHHFLGDTIGGFVLGVITLSLLILLVKKSRFLTSPIADFKTLSILWLPFLTIPFAEFLPVRLVGSLLGMNLATLFIVLQGNTLLFSPNTKKRIITAVGMLAFILLGFYFSTVVHFSNNPFLKLLVNMSLYFIIVRGSILIAKRINLVKYKL